MRNHKRVRLLALCIGFIFGFKPILVGAQSFPKVIIGYPARSIASIQLFIAQEKGFFREEGIDAQLDQVRADAAMAAVLTGSCSRMTRSAQASERFSKERQSRFWP